MSKILVVDDSVVDRLLAMRLIERRAGWTPLAAESGAEALALIESQAPDLVVTDLQMPGMNGLELVQAIHARHRHLPVVIMTSQGSEEFAVQALRCGAASYLPKSRLAQELIDIVDQVLAVARADHDQSRLQDCLVESESVFTIHNDPELIPPLVEHLRSELGRVQLCDESELTRVGIAVHESLVNAIDHGNLELCSDLREQDDQTYHNLALERRQQSPFKERRVRFRLRVTANEATCIVSDEGPGFDPGELPDPTDPANLERVFGRGLLLIRTFMDEVFHNETGNQITMVKRRAAEAM